MATISALPGQGAIEGFDPDPQKSYTLPARVLFRTGGPCLGTGCGFGHAWCYAGHVGALQELAAISPAQSPTRTSW